MGCVPVVTNPLMFLPFPEEVDYSFVRFIDATDQGKINDQLDQIVEECMKKQRLMKWRQGALDAAKALAFEDCDYANGLCLAISAVENRLKVLRLFLDQPSTRKRGYDTTHMREYILDWK